MLQAYNKMKIRKYKNSITFQSLNASSWPIEREFLTECAFIVYNLKLALHDTLTE